MLNHKKLSAKVCSVALTLAMVFTAMMPTAAFADGPSLTITANPASGSVQYGDKVTLTADVVGATGTPTYQCIRPKAQLSRNHLQSTLRQQELQTSHHMTC